MAGHSATGMGLRRRRLRLSLRLRATAARAAAADPGGPRRDSESDGHHRLTAGTRRVGLGDGGSSEQSMIVIVWGGLYRGQRSGVETFRTVTVRARAPPT